MLPRAGNRAIKHSKDSSPPGASPIDEQRYHVPFTLQHILQHAHLSGLFFGGQIEKNPQNFQGAAHRKDLLLEDVGEDGLHDGPREALWQQRRLQLEGEGGRQGLQERQRHCRKVRRRGQRLAELDAHARVQLQVLYACTVVCVRDVGWRVRLEMCRTIQDCSI